jgi:hypothetical protein
MSQLGRPLQVESLPAAVLFVAHGLAGYHMQLCVAFNSNCVSGDLATNLARAETLILAATLIAVWFAFARGEARTDRFLRASAAAVVAFVALGRVLSPQYLIWLVPLVPLVSGWRGTLAIAFLAAALAMTAAYFPGGYGALVNRLDQATAWTILIRDVTLVGLLAVLALPRPGHLDVRTLRRRSSAPMGAQPL